MRILVSACLLGLPCRYDGKATPCEAVLALRGKHELLPFCPEIYGGLTTPRMPAEIEHGRVRNTLGEDLTHAYQAGAAQALSLVRLLGCDAAILMERSPSCGVHTVYDGSFTRTLIPGQGVTAALLASNGIPVYSENECGEL